MTGKSATTNCYDAIEVWTNKPTPIREALNTITDEWIDDGQLCHQTALDLRDACKKMIDDYDRIKAEVIRMRDYAMRKSIPIGECVAWCAIKEHYGTGRSDQEDFDWLEKYDARSSS